MSTIFRKNYPTGKYELASPIVAHLIPAIYKRDPNDYMTGETWWEYGQHYVNRNYTDDWMESYLQKYLEVESYVPTRYYNDEYDEESE